MHKLILIYEKIIQLLYLIKTFMRKYVQTQKK